MKCDELEAEQWLDYSGEPRPCYPQKEVDSAIDQLKREHHRERHEYIDWVNKLQKENAELKAMVTTDNSAVIARLEDSLRKTQRALWLARAERAVAEQTVDEWSRYKEKHPFGSWREDPFDYWVQAWIYVEKLCRKKAKEYK